MRGWQQIVSWTCDPLPVALPNKYCLTIGLATATTCHSNDNQGVIWGVSSGYWYPLSTTARLSAAACCL